MVGRDDSKKAPHPEFLKTKTLGSRDLANIDYDDELPTGVDHRSERPPIAGSPSKVDPNDVYYLTDRPPPRSKLPSFTDTAPGPASMETPRRDLPPVTPSPEVPVPPAGPQPAVHPLGFAPAPLGAQASTQPVPLVSRSRRSLRPGASHKKKRHTWKPVVPPPRFPPSEPLARPTPPGPVAQKPGPKPVEDRLINALGVLFIGASLAFLAGWAFMTVTNTRVAALSAFITDPNHPLPSFEPPAPPTASATSP